MTKRGESNNTAPHLWCSKHQQVPPLPTFWRITTDERETEIQRNMNHQFSLYHFLNPCCCKYVEQLRHTTLHVMSSQKAASLLNQTQAQTKPWFPSTVQFIPHLNPQPSKPITKMSHKVLTGKKFGAIWTCSQCQQGSAHQVTTFITLPGWLVVKRTCLDWIL